MEQTLEQRARHDRQHYPDIVRDLPEGFVSLNNATVGLEEVLSVFFWSTTFVVQCSESITIFQTEVKDRRFILIYQNEYYVNERVFSEIVEYATNISENRNRVYRMGDSVEIGGVGGVGITHNIQVVSISRVFKDEELEGLSSYNIRLNISPAPLGGAIRYLVMVETLGGRRHNSFSVVDENTVHVRILEGDEIALVEVINPSPGFFFEGSQRKIRIE